MTTTRRLHVIIATVSALALSVPAAAEARAKVPKPPSPTVTAGVAFDGGFSGSQCDAIAAYITEQVQIAVNADLNTAAGRKAFAAAKAEIDRWLDQGMEGGCFFSGLYLP